MIQRDHKRRDVFVAPIEEEVYSAIIERMEVIDPTGGLFGAIKAELLNADKYSKNATVAGVLEGNEKYEFAEDVHERLDDAEDGTEKDGDGSASSENEGNAAQKRSEDKKHRVLRQVIMNDEETFYLIGKNSSKIVEIDFSNLYATL